ncbi:MAG: Gfo/Idh/MocA family oxidoreductase [Dysgonamonadaceae bacterium]|jgi:predicted dehydrogenase|nr:Gfo/Idh/MocA family oxidoreductase [Dysgonamonadaceae bacterium]
MLTRRNFLKTGGLVTAGLAISRISNSTTTAASYRRIIGSNKRVNLACIGIGNQGTYDINMLNKTGLANIVALCDVDMEASHTKAIREKFPDARRFKDFREMFEKASNEFDAVVAAVPDFAHFPIAMLALSEEKHIFVEKPMSRTFLEAQLMIDAAKKRPHLATQVGNQGHSEENYFQFKAWKEAGIIKDVFSVNAHMNNERRWHAYDENIKKFPDAHPIPETLDWDAWLSTAMYHDFSDQFHYGNWRSWYDFGMGALGDWGAHILDTVHEFLELGLPYEVECLRAEGHNDYFFPKSSTIRFRFPKRKKMPAVDITWYDGVNNVPQVPEGYGNVDIDPNIPLIAGGKLQPTKLGPGKEIYSKELIFKGGSHGSQLTIIPPEKAKAMEKRIAEVEVPKSPSNHYKNFLLACKGEERTRSPFEINGVLSQVFSLGVITQRLNIKIIFDKNTKTITNNAFANAFLTQTPPRKGWEEFYKL